MGTSFSEFNLTRRLHSASLRLVYLEHGLEMEFRNIPGFPEGWRWKRWIGAETTAGELVEGLIEELGVRKVILFGSKTARVDYVLQVASGSGSAGELLSSPPSSPR